MNLPDEKQEIYYKIQKGITIDEKKWSTLRGEMQNIMICAMDLTH